MYSEKRADIKFVSIIQCQLKKKKKKTLKKKKKMTCFLASEVPSPVQKLNVFAFPLCNAENVVGTE